MTFDNAFIGTTAFPIDIVVVTNKPVAAAALASLEASVPRGTRIIVTGIDGSASVNRNAGIREVESDIYVMMDDDITGFYPGWLQDLVFPMLLYPEIIICSARLMDESGSFGTMMGVGDQRDNRQFFEAMAFGYRGYRRLPTACLAIRRAQKAIVDGYIKTAWKSDIRFDEGFAGSGFEDTAWMNEINMQHPGRGIIVNNACRLTHLHHMQNQGGKFFAHNKAHYLKLYPDDMEIRPLNDYTIPRRREHFFVNDKDGHTVLAER